MIMTTLQLISVWKKVPLCSLLYYLPLTAGYSITMVSINPGKANSNRNIIDNPKPIDPPINPDIIYTAPI